MDLCKASAKDLNIFISENLQPNEVYLLNVGKAVDTICAFLKENCFKGTETKVLKVVKGGSTGKGTTLKGKSDADLVVFLSCFKDFKDQKTIKRKEIIDEIRSKLEAYKEDRGFTVTIEDSEWSIPRVLSFQLKLKNYQDVIECDVLPAYDALGPLIQGYKPDRGVYEKLLNVCINEGEFSTCFTELQRDFIKCRPTKVKSLIRLVKYWYKVYCEERLKVSKLPPKYALELLTIYAWEKDGQKENFNTAEVFRKVLELVLDYKNLCVYWLKYYDMELLRSQLQKSRPIIMDPADPTGNLGKDYRWDVVANAVEFCMSQPASVDLKIIGNNQSPQIVSVSPYTKIQQIKERIQLEQGTSIESQNLFLGDQELLNHHTLAHYGVCASTILQLKVQGSYCTIL